MVYQTLKHLQIVQSGVPFDDSIEGWIKINQIGFARFIHDSRQFEAAYLAWELVRKTRNPFFANGTGFEGYYLGTCLTPEAMLDQLIGIGHRILDSNTRLYRHNYRFQTRLMRTLVQERSDPEAMAVWSDELGATLGRLRAFAETNADAAYFQMETYKLVSLFPAITYREQDDALLQRYAIGLAGTSALAKPRVDLKQLKAADYEAGLVAWTIGEFGHPLVREYLRETGTSPFGSGHPPFVGSKAA